METSGVEEAGAGSMEQITRRKKTRVMVAIDESDYSFYALNWVIENLLDAMGITPEASREGEMLTLLHVQQPFHHLAFPAGPVGAYCSHMKRDLERSLVVILRFGFQTCKTLFMAVDRI